VLIKVEPFVNQSFFQVVDVRDLATVTVQSLLQNAPDRVINRTDMQAVWWPVLRPDEVRRLGRQQCNRFASTVSRGILSLKREEEILNEWLTKDVATVACFGDRPIRTPFVFTPGSMKISLDEMKYQRTPLHTDLQNVVRLRTRQLAHTGNQGRPKQCCW